nr:hypothetical protein CFP56_28773 [Quercus suber]
MKKVRRKVRANAGPLISDTFQRPTSQRQARADEESHAERSIVNSSFAKFFAELSASGGEVSLCGIGAKPR